MFTGEVVTHKPCRLRAMKNRLFLSPRHKYFAQ